MNRAAGRPGPAGLLRVGLLDHDPGPRELGTLAAPFSLSGQPALSVLLHRTGGGLPVGVQVVARRGADELLLDLARELQEAADWTARRPPAAP